MSSSSDGGTDPRPGQAVTQRQLTGAHASKGGLWALRQRLTCLGLCGLLHKVRVTTRTSGAVRREDPVDSGVLDTPGGSGGGCSPHHLRGQEGRAGLGLLPGQQGFRAGGLSPS